MGGVKLVMGASGYLMHYMPPLDHGKAARELGWAPRPTPDAVREHARFFRALAERT